MNTEDDAEGQGGSGLAAKLRLTKPLPAGEGQGLWVQGAGGQMCIMAYSCVQSQRCWVEDSASTRICYCVDICVEIIGENAGCWAALSGHGADPPWVEGPQPVPALPPRSSQVLSCELW